MTRKALPGDGRPRSDRRQRSEGVYVRLLPAEKALIADRAAAAGMTMPEFLRCSATRDGRVIAVRQTQASAAALVRLSYHLGKVGTNINQLAHQANAGRFPEMALLTTALDELVTVQKDVHTALNNLAQVDEETTDLPPGWTRL